MKLHKSITPEQIMEACERYQRSLDNPGFCISLRRRSGRRRAGRGEIHLRVLRRSRRLRGRAAFDRDLLT